MKLSTTISLLALASLGLAGKQFKLCRDFDSLGGTYDTQIPGLNITVKEEASLLVYPLKDVPLTNIPVGFGKSYNLKDNDDGFTICDDQMVFKSDCSAVGEYSLKAPISSSILNVFAQPGFETFYPIHEPGIYCVIVVHEHPDDCVSVKFLQPYGILPVESFWKMMVFKKFIIPIDFLLALFAITKLIQVKLNRRKALSYLGRNICTFIILNAGYKLIYTFQLIFLNANDIHWISFIIITTLNCVWIYCLDMFIEQLYYFSQGYGGLLYDEISTITLKFRIIGQIYSGVGRFVDITVIYSEIDVIINKILNLIGASSFMAMYIIYFKSSKESLEKIEDGELKRKYNVIRTVAVVVPIISSLVSVLTIIGKYFASSDILERTASVNHIFGTSLELENLRLIEALLENLISFSWTIISFTLVVIWRKDLKTDNFNQYNDPEKVE